MDRGRVEIDADLATTNHLFQEEIREARRQGAGGRTGKRAIEIAAIGQVAGASDEAISIDHRDGEQSPGDVPGLQCSQYTPDDLDSVQLIAVDGRRDEHCRSGPRPVEDMDG
jgi:hypothetical protein